MTQLSSHEFMLSMSDLSELLGEDTEKIKKLVNSHGGEFHLFQGKAYIAPQIVRRILLEKGYQYPKQVISLQMLKGGVAKTTTCLNIGLRAHMYGARVLFLDLDQQANLSFALGVDDVELPVFVDILEKKKTLKESIISIDEGLGLLPSNLNNSVVDRVLLSGHRNLASVLAVPLKEVAGDYDLILIDTAPALSALNTAVSLASSKILLPINPDKFALVGLQKHLADLKAIREEFGVSFEEKILFTKFDTRESASHIVLEKCLDSFGENMLKSLIRTSSDIKSVIGTKKTVFSQKSKAKEDYDLVTREVMGLWC